MKKHETFIGFLTLVLIFTNSVLAQIPSFQGLGDLSGGSFYSQAFAVSADGSVVVGSSRSALSGSNDEAFYWTRDEGMIGLGDFDGGSFYSRAQHVSADGRLAESDGGIYQVALAGG